MPKTTEQTLEQYVFNLRANQSFNRLELSDFDDSANFLAGIGNASVTKKTNLEKEMERLIKATAKLIQTKKGAHFSRYYRNMHVLPVKSFTEFVAMHYFRLTWKVYPTQLGSPSWKRLIGSVFEKQQKAN